MSNQYLKLRRSAVPGKVPTTESIDYGEIALNTYDGLAFMKKSGSNGEEVIAIGPPPDTGSLLTTASFNTWTGSNTSYFSGTASYAETASYALNIPVIDLTGYVTTSSFNNFTASYNTGSFSGSFVGTASWAYNAETASYLPVGTYNITSSWAQSASNAINAQTASHLNTLNQDVYITGSVYLNGTASIDVLKVTYISSSIIYSSGSNQLGDSTADTQSLYGRVIVSGSLETTGAAYLPNLTGSLQGTASWAFNALTASTADNFTVRGNLIVSGNTTIGNATTDTITMNAATMSLGSGTGILNIDSNTFVVDGANNRVGIGTSSPQNTLDVIRGTAGAMGRSTYEVAAFSYDGDAKIGFYNAQSTIGGGVSLLLGKSNATTTNDGTYPGFEFQMSPNLTEGNNFVRYNFVGRNGAGVVTNFSSDILNIYADGRITMTPTVGGATISANPRLGIGTSTPTSSLHINLSNTDITNTNGANSHIVLTNPSATGQTSITSIINGVIRAKWRTDFVGNTNWVAGSGGSHAFYTDGDFNVGRSQMAIFNNGNVVIGTTSIGGSNINRGFKLDISGSGASGSLNVNDVLQVSGSNVRITGSLIASGSSHTLAGNTVVTGSFTVVTGSSVELQVTNTGVNIGNLITDIHTVTGSLRVSGSITGSLSGSVTGSLFGTASWATNAQTASFLPVGIYAITASWAQSASNATNAISSSYPIRVTGSTLYSVAPLSTNNPNTSNNIFLGQNAGSGSTNVGNSNFIGPNAGRRADNANYSNFFGAGAGQLASNANNSNFLGQSTGYSASNAYQSNFIGNGAGYFATNARDSNFFGQQAGNIAISAESSNFFGRLAGYLATNAAYSNFLGPLAGYQASSASYSTLIGYQAGKATPVPAEEPNKFIDITTITRFAYDEGNFAGGQVVSATTQSIVVTGDYSYLTQPFTCSVFTLTNPDLQIDPVDLTYYPAPIIDTITYDAFNDQTTFNFVPDLEQQYHFIVDTFPGIGSNNIVIGTNITLETSRQDSINIGGIIFGTGSYSDVGPTYPYTGSAGGRIGINVVDPQYTLDVDGSGNYTNNLTVTGSFTVTGSSAFNGNVEVISSGSQFANIAGSILLQAGSGDYLSLSPGASYDNGYGFFVNCWFKLAEDTGNRQPLFYSSTNQSTNLYIEIDNGLNSITVNDDSGPFSFTTPETLQLDKWYFLTVAYDCYTNLFNTTGSIYLNGTASIDTYYRNSNFSFTDTTDLIGTDNAKPFSGYITDVRLVAKASPSDFASASIVPTSPLQLTGNNDALLLRVSSGGTWLDDLSGLQTVTANGGNTQFNDDSPYDYYYSIETQFTVDGTNEKIYTKHSGSDIGLKLDFANNKYSFGDFTNTISGSSITIDDITKTISVTGSLIAPNITGSLQGTASYVSGSIFDINNLALSSSYALTASYVNPLRQNVIITGSLLVTQSHISTVDYIDFTPIATPPSFLTGRLHWTDDTKTLQLDTDINGFELEIGHQNVVRGRNVTGYTLTKGMLVYINGESGNRPTFTTSSYEADSVSAATLGFVAQDIIDNQTGYVITSGLIRGINTNAYAPGTQLYLSSSGQYTSTIPISPLHEVRLGKTITQATNGIIYVDIMNGYEIGELHDVSGSTYRTGDLLVYNSGSKVWTNTKQLSGSYSVTGSFTISGSSTFTNIGPAIFSGSVTATRGFTGSFTGSVEGYVPNTATSSFVTNAQTSSMLSPYALTTELNSYLTTGSSGTTQTISGSLVINQNLTVLGSSSIQYVTSSQLDISTNIITVNVANPAIRFGGLSVIDSGSSPQESGSFLYDSVQDEFIFVHRGNGTDITSSHFLVGPETYNSLGNEIYIPANTILKAVGNEHVTGSSITDTGTTVSINSNTQIIGSDGITKFSLENGTIKTVSGSTDVGLKLDFANNAFYLGNNVNNLNGSIYIDAVNNEETFINNRTIILGDDGSNNSVKLQIEDINQKIKTIDLAQEKGLYLDFLNTFYSLGTADGGDFTNTIFGIKINSGNGLITIGDNWAYSTPTKIDINAPAQTISVTGSLNTTGSVFFPSLTEQSQANVVLIDTASGQLYYTASSAIGGGGPGGVYTVVPISSTPYNASQTSGDIMLLVDATGGTRTVNLPTAVGNTAKFTIKKIDTGTNTVTVDANGSETIDGGLTALLQVPYVSITLISDNSNWFVI